jgi:hypothetical protein
MTDVLNPHAPSLVGASSLPLNVGFRCLWLQAGLKFVLSVQRQHGVTGAATNFLRHAHQMQFNSQRLKLLCCR